MSNVSLEKTSSTPVGILGFLLQPSCVSGMTLQGVVKWCQLFRGGPLVRDSHTGGVPLPPECLLV